MSQCIWKSQLQRLRYSIACRNLKCHFEKQHLLLLNRIFLKDENGDLSDFIIWDFSVMNLVYFYLTVMTRSFDWIKPNRISRYLTKINYVKIVLVLVITLKRSDSTPLSLLLEIRFEGEINPSGRSFNFG